MVSTYEPGHCTLLVFVLASMYYMERWVNLVMYKLS
jgi:hypothetical protein